VRAFNHVRRRVGVIGSGELLASLRQLAGPTVEILGTQPIEVLRYSYSHAKALVFPGEEDFGIVPVEAMAAGCPIIAFRKGGACETVVEGRTGVFFDEQTVESLVRAVRNFEAVCFDPEVIVNHATTFGTARFRREMSEVIDAVVEAKRRQPASVEPYRGEESTEVQSPHLADLSSIMHGSQVAHAKYDRALQS
jgi:glycosyltransferase involved in cell wall biosynthesis